MNEADSPEREAAENLGLALTILRSFRGRSQKEQAAHLGIHTSTISRLEAGRKPPNPSELARLLVASSLPPWVLDHLLLPFLSALRQLVKSSATLLAGDHRRAALLSASRAESAMQSLTAFARLLAEMDLDANPAPPPAGLPTSDRIAAVLAAANLHVGATATVAESPAWPVYEEMVLHLCESSVTTAANSASSAYEIAALAVRFSDVAPGPPLWRRRLSGYTRAFLGNALRVQGDLRGADSALAAAWLSWRQGEDRPGTQLAEWRLLDLEASVRRALRQFDEAVVLLDRALLLAPSAAHPKILCNKALVLEQGGDIEGALRIIAAAERLAQPPRARELWALLFNKVVLLCHLGKYHEAYACVRELDGEQKGTGGLDALRLLWLKGRVAEGLGDPAAAMTALETVRIEFIRCEMPYDAALVSLELAAAYLRNHRHDDVAQLAAELTRIFDSLTVQREALAALQLFQEAARAKRETLSMVTSALRQLTRDRPASLSRVNLVDP